MRYFFVLISLLLLQCASAQSRLGNWQAYFNNTQFGDSPFRFQFDLQHRDHNLLGDLDQIIVRPGIQYMHTPSGSSYLAGYSFFLFQNEGTPNVTVTEHRLFQDIDLRHSVGRVAIRHRYRFEERFVESSPFAFRFRYALFANIPVNNKVVKARTLYIPFWSEIFINASGAPFDRNWTYLGIGYQLTDNFGFQFGGMNQIQTSIPKAQVVVSLHHNMHLNSGN